MTRDGIIIITRNFETRRRFATYTANFLSDLLAENVDLHDKLIVISCDSTRIEEDNMPLEIHRIASSEYEPDNARFIKRCQQAWMNQQPFPSFLGRQVDALRIRSAVNSVRSRAKIVHWFIMETSLFPSPAISLCKRDPVLNFLTILAMTKRARVPPIVYKLMFRNFDGVLAGSNALASFLHRLGTMPPLEVVPAGVDLSRFKPPSDKISAKTNLGVNPERPVITWCGPVFPTTSRDVSYCIQSSRKWVKRGGVSFVFAFKHEMPKRWCYSEGGIKFLVKPDMSRLLAASDCLILPFSKLSQPWVSTPLTAAEALASGVPVITTQDGGLDSIVKHGQTGFLVSGIDEVLSASIALCNDYVQLRNMAALARNFAVRNLNLKETAKTYRNYWMRGLYGHLPS